VTTIESPKPHAIDRIDAVADGLVALSHDIHSRPELAFEEVHASAVCADALERGGFVVERGACDLETAFIATAGSGPLHIAICCEYDALPVIGHACGHNIIAAAAVGAGLGLAALADDLGLTVSVLGTPAEEGGGGKIVMLERGGFDGIHAAMMVHPAPLERPHMACLAVSHFDVHYTGRAAHASAYPDQGINAADALTIAQVAIGLLRQHARPGNQVHGIITNGGAAPNIIPERTDARYYARAHTLADLAEWQPRVEECFRAGAIGTGASLEINQESPTYSEFLVDEAISQCYQDNAQALGRVFAPPGEFEITASTDMANVSLAIPSIHPTLGIDSLPAVNHQIGFTVACATPTADRAAIDGAKAMAATIVDLAEHEGERIRLMARAYDHAADRNA
jgi:amidohydrolase